MAFICIMKKKLKAVFMVAGLGSRLRPLTTDMPKCLVEIKGKPLLHYSIEKLLSVGVQEFIFVVGYKAELIQASIATSFPHIKKKFIYNKDFASKNSIFSYYLARNHVQKCSFFRLAGDLLYSSEILFKLINQTKICSAVEKKREGTCEDFPVKVNEKNSSVIEYGKHIPQADSFGVAQGIDFIPNRFSLVIKKSLEYLISHNKLDGYPESAYEQAMRWGHEVRYCEIGENNFWCEIDNFQDLENAKKLADQII